MNIGTKTGAKKAYLAEAEPMKRFAIITSTMNAVMSSQGGSSAEARNSPPAMASMVPRLDSLKKATNWAAKKASTM